MEGTQSPAPGWYDDPDGPGERWWDGERWTEHRHGSEPVAEKPGGTGLWALGYLLAIVAPPIGFFLGLAMIAGNRRGGGWVLAMSIVLGVFYLVVLTSR